MANATTTGTSTAVAPMTTGTCPPTAGIGGVFGSIAPLLLMLVAFYFLLVRPQQKRDAKRREMINAVKRGDKVVLTSGIIGTIHKIINDREISLEISEEVRIRVLKTSISDILDKSTDIGKNEAEIEGKEAAPQKKTAKTVAKKGRNEKKK